MTELHRIEAGISAVPDIVIRTHFKLLRLRFVVRTSAQEAKNISLFVELQIEIKALQMQIAESEAFGTKDKTKRLTSLLKELQSLTVKDCSWGY